MFDISISELFVIILAIIIFVAPKNLPTLARALGKITQKTKNFILEIKNEIDIEDRFKELKNIEKEIKSRSRKN